MVCHSKALLFFCITSIYMVATHEEKNFRLFHYGFSEKNKLSNIFLSDYNDNVNDLVKYQFL